MNDLSILHGNDRDEPVVIACAPGENSSVHFVLQDHDAIILRAVHNKCIAGVKLDRLAVSREGSHSVGSPSDGRRPTGEVIAGLKGCVFGECVEIVFTVNESA
jgi:hypothetical protein